jgi:hypothetical protein
MRMRGEMMMIAKMYEGYHDPDTDPQLIVALTVSRIIVTQTGFGNALLNNIE